MARRRDVKTRHYQRLMRRGDERAARGQIMDMNRTNDRNQRMFGGEPQSPERGLIAGMKGPSRQLGRRGERARARNRRIRERLANGTYTQPSGGDTTNS